MIRFPFRSVFTPARDTPLRISRMSQSTFCLLKNVEHIILVSGSAGGGVASGEMNRTIQQFLGLFARESFGTPSNFSIVLLLCCVFVLLY